MNSPDATAYDNTLLGDPSLLGALEACGWTRADDGLALSYQRGHRAPAELRLLQDGADWNSYELACGASPASGPEDILAQNASLEGPMKAVAHSGNIGLRVDIPAELNCVGDETFVADNADWSLNPYCPWAEDITAYVSGRQVTPTLKKPSPESFVEHAQAAGWSASLDDGHVHIHVQVPGIYRQVGLEPTCPGGYAVVADLVAMGGIEPTSYRAMIRLAGAANSRLLLVRFSLLLGGDPPRLRAEVCFRSALVPGA